MQGSGEARPVERLQLRVEAAAGGELSAQAGVLKQLRREQSRGDRQEGRAQVLNLPFQLHPPVLEPRFHLGKTETDISSCSHAELRIKWFY